MSGRYGIMQIHGGFGLIHIYDISSASANHRLG